MKKFLSILLAVVVLVSCCAMFASCGDNADSDNGNGGSTEAFKVGAIYITSKSDTAGYTYAHHNGITSAMDQLGLADDQLVIRDNVPEEDTAVRTAIDELVTEGCDIIIGISFGYINAMDAAAKEYTDVIFSHGTGYLSNETNFNNYFGRIYQARYLSGIAAGLKSLELQNNNIGYVSAHGTDYAETCSGINAFAMGCMSVNPAAKVIVSNIHTWGDEEKEKSAAELLINEYDCGVISQHCDSAQPQLVAQNKGLFGCGYNSDMSVQAPDAHLTAPIWNWDVYYKLAIETAKNDPTNFMTVVGNYYGGLKEGFVDISPISDNCVEGTKEKIEAVKALMVNGEWDVFSGVKLSFDEDGNVVKTDAALVDNAGNEIVAAGGASVEDSVITGSMNYYVEGVTEIGA